MNNTTSTISSSTSGSTVGNSGSTTGSTVGNSGSTTGSTVGNSGSTTGSTVGNSGSTSTSTIISSTTPSTSTTTTNICTAGYTHSTQLLYLNMNSYISWTYYSFNYTSPNVTTLTLLFSLRSDPNYWYVDDVSVTNSSGQELLSNGDFEQGTLANWVYCNPNNATASGYISNSHICNGYYCYKDGSIGSFDYLSQTFNVRPNQVYTVEFWLALDINHIVNMTFASITISY
jgi:hypothetical protein